MTDDTRPPSDLIGLLDYYLVKKAPFQLPDNVKEAIVRFGPWIALILLIISLPPLLFLLGLGALLVPFTVPFVGGAYAASFSIFTVFLIVQLALEIASLPGLFARRMSGWRLIFYSRLVSIVSLLLTGLIVNAIVGGSISLYILFQVRPLYRE